MNEKDQRVTMRTVAEKAGVSLMTVSRAFRNERRISPVTRANILRIAEELGYRPNPLVGALMADLRRTKPRNNFAEPIAFVVSHPTADGWRTHPTPVALFAGAQARADRLGFRLEPFWAGEASRSRSRLSKILRARGISGVVIAPFPVPAEEALHLDWEHFAGVALGYSLREPKIHRVTSHHLNSLRIALAELDRRGYRRIGLAVTFGHDERIHHYWATGFIYHQASIPARRRVPLFITRKLDRKAFNEWRLRYQPDAIIGSIGLSWLRGGRVAMPQDVGYVNLDYDSSMGDIAGIDQNHQAVGAAAVDLVVEQLYHNERGIPQTPKVLMIEGRWREGGTVRAPVD